jgi:hypothetical protein
MMRQQLLRSLKRAQRPASQANVVRSLSSSARLAADVELTIDGKKVTVEGMHHTSNATASESQC